MQNHHFLIVKGLGILLSFWGGSGAIATPSPTPQTNVLNPSTETLKTPDAITAEIHPAQSTEPLPDIPAIGQIPYVNQLSDIQPTDWAFQALQSLIEQYDLFSGYPDGTFRGDRPLTRNEFATALNLALEQLNLLIQIEQSTRVSQDDLAIVQRLQEEFSSELAVVQQRVDRLEADVAELEAHSFSTTTKLTGQAVFATNAGGFSGDRIIAPRGAVITAQNPTPTAIYRVSLNFNTSFTGTDLLQARLVTGSDGADDNAGGFLEPNFGSTLDFSIPGRDGQFSVARLYYTFTPADDLSITLGSSITAPDFVDKNRYANVSVRDFSTQALVNNFILFPRARGAGAAIEWHPGGDDFLLRAVYIAGDARNTLPENQQVFGGGQSEDIRLFPMGGGGASGGLFGDPYQGVVELEYAPSPAFALRLQHSRGRVFGSDFNAFGINAELTLGGRLGLFGRYGLSSYPNTTIGDINPQYWMAGFSFSDLFISRAIAGIAVGQPFIEEAVGDATQTNFELFYNVPIRDNIRITPLVQLVTNPGNQDANGAIFSGTVRTVFSF
ncbi:MAG: iron uptake porin [Oculatellaceae cyanobacterium Prado106]|jgi:porin|nr:iron uptake porin [Oculatellaceae cyanobacterium Prado106]